ncbi:unnamed protein product, partial [marine sediment metagenome]
GERGANALKILENAAKASAVGLGDTATVARTVTAAMQAYQKDGLSAARATEILVATVREGNLEAEALSGSLGRVIGIASQVGVSFDQVGSFIATFTRLGVNAEEATTSLRGTLSSILKPTEDARAAFEEIGLPIEKMRKIIAEDGLTAAMLEMVKAADGNAQSIARIIPNIRALSGVLGTAGAQGIAYADITEKIANSQGILDEAIIITTKTVGFQFNQMIASVKKLAVEFGTTLFPIIQDSIIPSFKALLDIANMVLDIFKSLPEPVRTIILVMGALAAALGPVVFAIGTLVATGGAIVASFGAMGVTSASVTVILTTLGATLTGVATAAGALVVGFGAFKFTQWYGEVTGLQKVWDKLAFFLTGADTWAAPAREEMELMSLATRIAGYEIKTYGRALEIVSNHTEKLREANNNSITTFEAYWEHLKKQKAALHEVTMGYQNLTKEEIEQLKALRDMVKTTKEVQQDADKLTRAINASGGAFNVAKEDVLKFSKQIEEWKKQNIAISPTLEDIATRADAIAEAVEKAAAAIKKFTNVKLKSESIGGPKDDLGLGNV